MANKAAGLFFIFSVIKLTASEDNSQEVKLTFKYVDGKLIPVVQHDPVGDPGGMSSAAISSVFLLLFIMLSLIGNSLLVGTIASSITLKRYPFNVLLMNIGVVCLLECLLNTIPSVIYIMTEPWQFGKWPCYINSATMEFVPFIYVVLLLSLMIDRYLAVSEPVKYRKNPQISRHQFWILIYWILSFIVISPLISGHITSWPFPDRYSCQPMDEKAVIYGAITGGLCHLISWLGLIAVAVMINRIFQAERKKERKALRGREQTNKLAEPTLFMFAMNPNGHFRTEMKNAGIVIGLVVLYLLLLVPYVIRVKVDQIAQEYNHNYYRNLTLAYYVVEDTSTETPNMTTTLTSMSPTTAQGDVTTLESNVTEAAITNNDLQEHDALLVPQVVEEHLGVIDAVCVWLRYIHAVLVPALIFLIHKDLRKKAEVILCCWRPNSVETRKNREVRPISAFMHQKRREWEKKQKKFRNVANYNVPVLFATSEGLYLRLVDENYGPEGFKKPPPPPPKDDVLDDSIKAQWSVEPRFVMEICDLQLPASAPRGRTPVISPTVNKTEAANNSFGTTVTVVVGKKEPNLKSSLKKPRNTEEDEGFIDAGSDPPTKKIVQFNTKIEEIPTLEPNSPSKRKKSRNQEKGFLPPLSSDGESPEGQDKQPSFPKDRAKRRDNKHEMIELQLRA